MIFEINRNYYLHFLLFVVFFLFVYLTSKNGKQFLFLFIKIIWSLHRKAHNGLWGFIEFIIQIYQFTIFLYLIFYSIVLRYFHWLVRMECKRGTSLGSRFVVKPLLLTHFLEYLAKFYNWIWALIFIR